MIHSWRDTAGRTVLVVVGILSSGGLLHACVWGLPEYSVSGPFRVLVLDRGHPVSGIQVMLSLEPSEAEFSNGTSERFVSSGVTDSRGVIRFSALPFGSYVISVKHGIGDGDSASLLVSSQPTHPQVDVVRLKWPFEKPLKTRTVSGRLIGGSYNVEAGKSQPLMDLSLIDGPSTTEILNAQTDHLGNFDFGNVSPGLYFLRIRTAPNQAWTPEGDIPIEVNATASTKKLDLELSESSCGLMYSNHLDCKPLDEIQVSSLCGRVIDPSGAVIPHATVFLRESDREGDASVLLNTRSNNSGDFALAPVADGRYLLLIKSTGFTSARIPVHLIAPRNTPQCVESLHIMMPVAEAGGSSCPSVSVEGKN